MAVTMNSAEIIRNAFHAVAQLGVNIPGAKVRTFGLALVITHADDSQERFTFQRTTFAGGDAYLLQATGQGPRYALSDDELRTEVRRIVAWVLS